jgi:flagellar motility protein MotE (MotC chaperone)
VKSIRLLPVVVVAVAAVLVLKTISLATNGGYVLAGVGAAQAAGGAAAPAAAPEGDATITFPPEPTMTDINPVLADPAPVLGQPEEAGADDHGAPAEAAHAEAPAETGHEDPAAPTLAEAPSAADEEPMVRRSAELPEIDDACIDHVTVDVLAGRPVGHEEPNVAPGVDPALLATPLDPDCVMEDAIPTRIDANGVVVPFAAGEAGSQTQGVLLERLSDRREQLQAYEEELALRASLVDAAEKRIEERSATLQALEARIAALVDQQKAMESTQFAGIVAMYEAMKPKDAAAIFNELEMDVLLRVAKAIAARKMAPILAEMSAQRAQELTVAMASVVTQPGEQMTPDDLASLPQIIGQ